jgi:hypothetical protein
LKTGAIEAYGGCCACCGERSMDFLCIDHIDGGGTQHRKLIGKGSTYRVLKNAKYPPGYRVLCANCNLAWGLFKRCPHRPGADRITKPYRIVR